jgi:hypothetical protein
MGKLPIEKCDPMKTVEIYKRIGVTRKDFPIQLDLPPRYALSKQERIALIIKGAVFYHQMTKEIDWTIPVVHGWTYEELSLSLSLIENPERLASGTFSGSAYDWVMGKLNSHEPHFKRQNRRASQRGKRVRRNNRWPPTRTEGLGTLQNLRGMSNRTMLEC